MKKKKYPTSIFLAVIWMTIASQLAQVTKKILQRVGLLGSGLYQSR